jgi:four helix bundle protein
MQNYKDLKVWEKAHFFTLKVYEATGNFPREEVYGLTNQLRRAAFSVPANIAEGCGKHSKNDFAHFLNIALGSANESEYFLMLAKDLKYLEHGVYDFLAADINEVKAMLIAFIIKVRT